MEGKAHLVPTLFCKNACGIFFNSAVVATNPVQCAGTIQSGDNGFKSAAVRSTTWMKLGWSGRWELPIKACNFFTPVSFLA